MDQYLLASKVFLVLATKKVELVSDGAHKMNLSLSLVQNFENNNMLLRQLMEVQIELVF